LLAVASERYSIKLIILKYILFLNKIITNKIVFL
jgi:hypothetical protein